MKSTPDVTEWLIAWGNGDKEALNKLIPQVYQELHRMAGRYMRRETPGHTLQTSALVNEAYLKLVDQKKVRWQNRAHFFGVAYGQVLAGAGKYNEAIDQLKKTVRLDPSFDAPHFSLAQIYENKGMIPEAIAETIEAYHLQGNEDAADLFKEAKDAKSYQEAKDTIARYELESLPELAKQKYVSALEFARRHAKLNEKDAAFEWLEKAHKERSSQLIFIRVLDDFKNLRSDPRFNDLVKRIGLPPEIR